MVEKKNSGFVCPVCKGQSLICVTELSRGTLIERVCIDNDQNIDYEHISIKSFKGDTVWQCGQIGCEAELSLIDGGTVSDQATLVLWLEEQKQK